MFNLLGMLISGLIIGGLARWIYPGSVPLDWIKTILLGIVGSFTGGFLTQLAKPSREGIRLHRSGLIVSILASIILLWGTRQAGLW